MEDLQGFYYALTKYNAINAPEEVTLKLFIMSSISMRSEVMFLYVLLQARLGLIYYGFNYFL